MDPNTPVYVARAERPVPELGIEVGDLVTVEPRAARPVTIEREVVANYGLLRAAMYAGALRPLTDGMVGMLAAVAREHGGLRLVPRTHPCRTRRPGGDAA